MEKKLKIGFKANRPASALIMTIVLTVLLAAVGVMFVAVARMDRAATSNIADNKTLDLAAKSIIEIINKELIYDTPGVQVGQEYYDYPDVNNLWLASTEPYYYNGTYRWHQISDVTGYLSENSSVTTKKSFAVRDVNVDPPGSRKVILDYPEIILNYDGELYEGAKTDGKLNDEYWGQLADADGDGIADSKWIKLSDLRSSKGEPIFAAVRVIDNSGMVNVNTAHTFDPGSNEPNRIDGSTQMQVNLKGMLKGADSIVKLHEARCGDEPNNWGDYWYHVIRVYEAHDSSYMPFDISDELEMRYRYCIDSQFVARIEANTPASSFRIIPATLKGCGTANFGHLYWGRTDSDWRLEDWEKRITEPNNSYADRRHLQTAYNYDRIIDPNGDKMLNINDADVNSLYNIIYSVTDDVNIASQLAVNIVDYRDSDPNVSVYPKTSPKYFGFESQPFISEIAAIIDMTDPNNSSYYALELYNPFNESVDLKNFTLSVSDGNNISLNGTIPAYGYYVISNDPNKFTIDSNSEMAVNFKLSGDYADTDDPKDGIFDTWSNYDITIKRTAGLNEIILDAQKTTKGGFIPAAPTAFCAQRNQTNWQIVYQNMTAAASATLGKANTVTTTSGLNGNFALANEKFITVGDVVRPLIIGPNTTEAGTIAKRLESASGEKDIRLDLSDPNYQQIFKYITVLDLHTGDGDVQIKGRININTAPAFVIAQLPWVSSRNEYSEPNLALAKAIVAYRDKINISNDPNYKDRPDPCGFGNIGQLCNIIKGTDPNYGIDYYSRDSKDQTGFPDLTKSDGASDDFEERDLIFSRISNLVTVRSDVFTAYILVRVGVTGPQKRYTAILDRSRVPSDSNGVRTEAFQYVPEAR